MTPLSGALPVPLKPVRVSVPSPVSMTCGLPALRACSWATLRVMPPILTLVRPSGLPTLIVPMVLSLGSPRLVSPPSRTLAWPVALALPSTGTMLGPPSVVPLMVIVSVVVLGSPSASVIV